jgi:hypothetical protein
MASEDELHQWIEAEDLIKNKRFFVHKETQKAQWQPPACLPTTLVDPPGYPPHPWQRKVSKITGQVYWQNIITRECTWRRPIPEAQRSVCQLSASISSVPICLSILQDAASISRPVSSLSSEPSLAKFRTSADTSLDNISSPASAHNFNPAVSALAASNVVNDSGVGVVPRSRSTSSSSSSSSSTSECSRSRSQRRRSSEVDMNV